MEILVSVLIGTVAGGLAFLVCRSVDYSMTTSMAVGILGSLLGAAANFWFDAGSSGDLTFSSLITSSSGAVGTLFLWIVAQRLFFANPEKSGS